MGYIQHVSTELVHYLKSSVFGHVEYNKMSCLLDLFLISKFRRILNVVFFLVGDSPASEFDVPTFRNTLSVPSSEAVWATYTVYENGTDCSEKSKHTFRRRGTTQKKEYNAKNVYRIRRTALPKHKNEMHKANARRHSHVTNNSHVSNFTLLNRFRRYFLTGFLHIKLSDDLLSCLMIFWRDSNTLSCLIILILVQRTTLKLTPWRKVLLWSFNSRTEGRSQLTFRSRQTYKTAPPLPHHLYFHCRYFMCKSSKTISWRWLQSGTDFAQGFQLVISWYMVN
jgi:hypothetical protein